MDLGEDEDFAFKHPYFFENFTFKFVGLNSEEKRDFENLAKSMGAKIFDDAEYILTDNLHPSSDSKNYYSISYLLDSMKAETPLKIEDYKFGNLVVSISQPKFCCANAKFIWRNKSCLSYYNENFCCKSCMRIRELQCDQVEVGETNSSNINDFDKELQCAITSDLNTVSQCANNGDSNEELQCEDIGDLNKESQCANNGDSNEELQCEDIGDLNKESQCANNGDSNEELQCDNIGDLNKESECANNGDSNEELQCEDIGDLNKEPQPVNIGALNKQISSLQVNENFDSFALCDNFDENLDDSAGQSQNNGVSQENGAHKSNSASSDMEIEEIQIHKDLEEPSCSTQKSKASKAPKKSTIDRRKKVKKLSSDSDTSSKNEDSRNLRKKPRISEKNKTSTIDRWKKRRIISSDSETSDKSEESEEPTRKRKSKRQRLSPSPSPETVTIQSSSDCEYIPSSEVLSSNSSSNEEEDFVTRTNPNEKKWWLELPDRETTERSGLKRKRDYEYHEKRIMLAYLIINDLINDGTSRKPWAQMIKDGYMTDRSVESLNNHFRKTLLPNIESFKLPQEIEDQFIKCRKRHTGRK